MNLRDWIQHRHRKTLTWYGRTFRSLPRQDKAILALFCDFEGGYAGPASEQYAETGTETLLGILSRHGVKITFNIVADLCLSQPHRIQKIIDAGHEIACHGWRHEQPRDLSAEQLDQSLKQAMQCFERVGVRPKGFRSPQSAWSANLLHALVAHGFQWNAERDRAKRPYHIVPGLVRIGVTTDDWDLSVEAGSVADLMNKWRRYLAKGITAKQVTAIGVHEWLLGQRPEYATALDVFLDEAKQIPDLSLATLGQV